MLFGLYWGSNPDWNGCHPQTLPLGQGCIHRSHDRDSINTCTVVQEHYLNTPTREIIQVRFTWKALISIWGRTACSWWQLILHDLKFSSEVCFARRFMTKQFPWPDHEILGEGLGIFSGMCTLSNCILQSFSLKLCMCEFVPLLNWKKHK